MDPHLPFFRRPLSRLPLNLDSIRLLQERTSLVIVGVMKYRALGSSGPQVSAIGMGCMPLSVRRDRPDEREAIGVIHHAVDCGITFFDTADSYCIDDTETGHNEQVIGKALRELAPSVREKIVVATKGGLIRPEGRWDRDGRPESLRKAVEASLKRLGVERIDLYQHHRIDPEVPLEDSLGVIAACRDEGKIAHVGVSNYGVDEIKRGTRICPITSVQNQFSPDHRQPERPVGEADPSLDPNTAGTLQFTDEHGLAFLPWCPLGGMGGAKQWAEPNNPLAEFSRELGASAYQLVLGWHLAKGSHVIPIPGASRASSVEDSAKAADLELSGEVLAKLEAMLSL